MKKIGNYMLCAFLCLMPILTQAAEEKLKKIELSLTHLLNSQLFTPKQRIGTVIDTIVQNSYESFLFKEKRKQSCQRVNCTSCEPSSAFRYQLDILKGTDNTTKTISQNLQGIASLLHTDIKTDPATQNHYNTFKLIDLSQSIRQCYTDINSIESHLFLNAESIKEWKKTHKEPVGAFELYWTWEKVVERLAEHNETARIAREAFLPQTATNDTSQGGTLS